MKRKSFKIADLGIKIGRLREAKRPAGHARIAPPAGTFDRAEALGPSPRANLERNSGMPPETRMGFEELLDALDSATSLVAKQHLVRAFTGAHESPLVKDRRVTFFYTSPEANSVALAGDWTGWQPTAPMAYLPDTPLWYRVEEFPRDARLEYRIVVNGRARLDPRNPRIAPSGLGPHSEVVMPDYRLPREIADESRIPRGTVQPHWITSRALEDRRTFWVCLPPGYDPQKRYRTVYFNDGGDYLRYADLPRIMDYLVAREFVPPFIAILVKPNHRAAEYACSNTYTRFCVNELVPWVDQNFPTLPEAQARAIVGASMGALQAAHMARRRPNIFGLVAGQSGYYSFQNDALGRDYAAAPNLGIRFHFVVGHFETHLQGVTDAVEDFVAAQRRLVNILRAKQYPVECGEYPEGHAWNFWRAHIGDALRFFWGHA